MSAEALLRPSAILSRALARQVRISNGAAACGPESSQHRERIRTPRGESHNGVASPPSENHRHRDQCACNDEVRPCVQVPLPCPYRLRLIVEGIEVQNVRRRVHCEWDYAGKWYVPGRDPYSGLSNAFCVLVAGARRS
jgi:hypothetical protein